MPKSTSHRPLEGPPRGGAQSDPPPVFEPWPELIAPSIFNFGRKNAEKEEIAGELREKVRKSAEIAEKCGSCHYQLTSPGSCFFGTCGEVAAHHNHRPSGFFRHGPPNTSTVAPPKKRLEPLFFLKKKKKGHQISACGRSAFAVFLLNVSSPRPFLKGTRLPHLHVLTHPLKYFKISPSMFGPGEILGFVWFHFSAGRLPLTL